MRKMWTLAVVGLLAMVATPVPVHVQGQSMSFFVSSESTETGGSIPENYNPESGTRVGEENDTRAGREGEGV